MDTEKNARHFAHKRQSIYVRIHCLIDKLEHKATTVIALNRNIALNYTSG